MKLSLKAFLNYIAVFIVFAGTWTFPVPDSLSMALADLRISYFIMGVILLLWLPILNGLHFNKGFLFLFSILLFTSSYNIFVGNDSLGGLLRQFIGISTGAFFYYQLIRINNFDVKGLFKVYLNIAFFIALIGMIQEVSYLLGFTPGYDYSSILPQWKLNLSSSRHFLRVNSILPEPTHFCNVMIPAFFVSIISFLKNNFEFQPKWKSVIIIIAFFLSFSTSGYITVLFCLFLVLYNYRKVGYIVTCGLIIYALTFFLYNNVFEFRGRIRQSVEIVRGQRELSQSSTSTYNFFSNAYVAYNSFKDSPLIGSGLGSHKMSYLRYIGILKPTGIDIARTNVSKQDANSLFLRLLSETGLLGIVIFFGFIFRFHVYRKRDISNYLWVISNAILAVFFIRLLRLGHYFSGGFFFFFWMYYFSNVKLETIKHKGPQGIRDE